MRDVPQTGAWAFQTDSWRLWQSSTRGPGTILNIVGGTGTGKSSICATSLRRPDTSTRPMVSHFFDSRLGADNNSSELFLANLLVQLFRASRGTSKEALFEKLRQSKASKPTVWDEEFWNLLRMCDCALKIQHKVLIVIDNLDLCLTNKSELLSWLEFQADCGTISLVVTSKASVLPVSACKTLDLALHSSNRAGDVQNFITTEINKLEILARPRHRSLRNKAIQVGSECCKDNYLIADCFIRLVKDQRNPRSMEKMLRNAPHECANELFQNMLDASNERYASDHSSIARRNNIFRVLIATRLPQTLQDIDIILAIDENGKVDEGDLSFDTVNDIQQLCGHFVTITATSHVMFFHERAEVFIGAQDGTSYEESDLYLAKKCLAILSSPKARDWHTGSELLRRRLRPSLDDLCEVADDLESSVYRYAALYFQVHVTALRRPPKDVTLKTGRFLSATEYVTWAETVPDFRPGTSYATQVNVRIKLSDWVQTLEPAYQEEDLLQGIKNYFVGPYKLIASIIHEKGKDHVLEFLPHIRLGEWYNATGRSMSDLQKGYKEKVLVVNGLSTLLSPNDPFLLKQNVLLWQESLWQRRFREGLSNLQDLYEQQQGVATQDDLNYTSWLIGSLLLALNRYNESDALFSRIIEAVRDAYGEKHRFLYVLLLHRGIAIERMNKLDEAAAIFRAAKEIMTDIAGPDNVLVLTLNTCLGGVLRKQGGWQEAEGLLLLGWTGRQNVFSLDQNVVVDAALQTAFNYRDQGNAKECLEILHAISSSTVLAEDFERHCQFQHTHALVQLDSGEYVLGRNTLLALFHDASGENRHKNNRELLWARLHLAPVMRSHGEEKDASMLFADLVTSKTVSEVDGEPEPPAQLAIAEKALELVRQAKFEESQALLDENELRWIRDADFWFSLQGGPILDTSIIAPIRDHRV